MAFGDYFRLHVTIVELFVIDTYLVPIILIIGTILSIWVLAADRKNRINQTFFIVTICLLLWIVFAYLGFADKNYERSLIWYRLNLGVIYIFFLGMYFFSVYFPRKSKVSPLVTWMVVMISVIFSLLSVFSNFIVQSVNVGPGGSEIVFGQGNLLYNITTLVLTSLILWNLFREYFILTRREKLQAQYVLIGIVVLAVLNIIFNVVLPAFGNDQYYRLGDYSVIFFLGFAAYAIVKGELFGIKVILTQALVFSIGVLLLWQTAVAFPSWFDVSWKGVLFILFVIFGRFLTKSVIQEIKQREQIEKLAQDVQRSYELEKKAKEELEKLDKFKDQFLMTTQHNLRTPLTSMRGYSDLLLIGTFGKQPTKTIEVVGKLKILTDGMIKMVNDFLDMA